jgi:hypothetical protein
MNTADVSDNLHRHLKERVSINIESKEEINAFGDLFCGLSHPFSHPYIGKPAIGEKVRLGLSDFGQVVVRRWHHVCEDLPML